MLEVPSQIVNGSSSVEPLRHQNYDSYGTTSIADLLLHHFFTVKHAQNRSRPSSQNSPVPDT